MTVPIRNPGIDDPGDDGIEALICRVYGTLMDFGGWQPCLQALQRRLGAGTAALMSHDFKENNGEIVFWSKQAPALADSYRDYFAARNPWLPLQRFTAATGTLEQGETILSPQELQKTEFYHEWLKPQEILHRLSLTIHRDGEEVVFFSIMRSRAQGSFSEAELAQCRILMPHLRQAFRIQRKLADLHSARTIMNSVVDRLPVGIVFVDARSRPLFANHAAERLLSANSSLDADASGLKTADDRLTATLRRRISRAIGAGEVDEAPLSVPRPAGGADLSVFVCPLPGQTGVFALKKAIAAVYIFDPEENLSLGISELRRRFGLTPAEARIAASIAGGRGVEGTAERLDISRNTARVHLQRVYQKVGVTRQSELVHRLLTAGFQLNRRDRTDQVESRARPGSTVSRIAS